MMHSVSDDCCFAVASTEKNEKNKKIKLGWTANPKLQPNCWYKGI